MSLTAHKLVRRLTHASNHELCHRTDDVAGSLADLGPELASTVDMVDIFRRSAPTLPTSPTCVTHTCTRTHKNTLKPQHSKGVVFPRG
jgi:hypothetical protein